VSERKGGSVEIWASEWRHGARYALASYSLYGKCVGICGFSEPGYYEFTSSYTFSMEAGKRTRVPSVVTAIL